MSNTPHLTAAIGYLEDGAAALLDSIRSKEADTAMLLNYNRVVRGLLDALKEMEEL